MCCKQLEVCTLLISITALIACLIMNVHSVDGTPSVSCMSLEAVPRAVRDTDHTVRILYVQLILQASLAD